MANQNPKRKRDDDSDEEKKKESWPQFITLQTWKEGKPITKISPFVVQKCLQSIIGEPKSVKKIGNNKLLVECKNKQQSLNLTTKILNFNGTSVTGSPYHPLNKSKGVVKDFEDYFDCLSEADLEEELQNQGVTDVKRIKIKKNDDIIYTKSYILTFDTPTLPEKLKVGYFSMKINLYIPNPLRCFKCQKFGHSALFCKGETTCFKCGNRHEKEENCSGPPKCVNCGEAHFSSSKNCTTYLKEKEIQKIKTEKRISYPEARKLYNSHHPSNLNLSNSYSSIVKKVTKEVACQTGPELSTRKETRKDSSSLKPSVPQKSANVIQKTKNHEQTKTHDKAETEAKTDSTKRNKQRSTSDRIPKGSIDPQRR